MPPPTCNCAHTGLNFGNDSVERKILEFEPFALAGKFRHGTSRSDNFEAVHQAATPEPRQQNLDSGGHTGLIHSPEQDKLNGYGAGHRQLW